MNDDGIAGHNLSKIPRVIMNAIMMYDLIGMISHIRRLPISIFCIRRTFLKSILVNIAENSNSVTMQPTIIMTEVASTHFHDVTPILQTLMPATSQIRPSMNVSVLVFISV